MSRRPGFLVYGLLFAFVVGSAFPLYWSFVIGSVTKERAIQSPPPLYPGGHFLDNARRVRPHERCGRDIRDVETERQQEDGAGPQAETVLEERALRFLVCRSAGEHPYCFDFHWF